MKSEKCCRLYETAFDLLKHQKGCGGNSVYEYERKKFLRNGVMLIAYTENREREMSGKQPRNRFV